MGLAVAAALAAVDPLVLEAKTFKVIASQQDGKKVEKLVEALGAKPGETLEFQYLVENTTEKALNLVRVPVKLDPAVAYMDGTADSPQIAGLTVVPEFSYDGGARYGKAPLMKKVKVVEAGKEVEKEVEVKPEEYTNVRWVLPQVAAKQKLTLKLRVMVR